MIDEVAPLIFSPVKHRYRLAARQIEEAEVNILDVGGYRSREQHLAPYFRKLIYTSVNVGPAWYRNEESHHLYDGIKLPYDDHTFPYVISVDTIEHIPRDRRGTAIREIIRVAEKKAIIVVPISHGDIPNESYILEYSRRFGIAPMPSLAEHLKYGLPTLMELTQHVGPHFCEVTFASPRHLYWSFQTAMLLNQATMGNDAEFLNRRLYDRMEEILDQDYHSLMEAEAYRAVVTVARQKNPDPKQ